MNEMTDTIKPITPRGQQATRFATLVARIAASPFAFVRYVQTRRAIAHLSQVPDRMLKDMGIVRSDIARVVRQGRRHTGSGG
jgi:uncharacterized protein YjiS (DUF1127 family)